MNKTEPWFRHIYSPYCAHTKYYTFRMHPFTFFSDFVRFNPRRYLADNALGSAQRVFKDTTLRECPTEVRMSVGTKLSQRPHYNFGQCFIHKTLGTTESSWRQRPPGKSCHSWSGTCLSGFGLIFFRSNFYVKLICKFRKLTLKWRSSWR